MKRFIIASMALAVSLFPVASQARLGGAGAQFLINGSGSRAQGLGGAYTAFAEGVEAIYWNPAGLARIEGIDASFTHTQLFADFKGENVAFATAGLGGVIGLSGVAFLSGDIPVTTEEEQDGTGDTYSANDFAAGLSYARMMTDKFTAGITLKFIAQNIHKCSAFGWAFDIGGIYNTGLRNLRVGFVIQNFGPDLRYQGADLEFEGGSTGDVPTTYKSEPYSLPLTFQMGAAYDIMNMGGNRLTATIDGVHPIDQSETFATGLEYSFNDTYFLRLGYTERNERGFCGGLGVKIPLGDNMGTVDYTYEDHDYLDAIQRFTIGFSSR